MEIVQPLWKTVWQSRKQFQIELTYDLTIPLWGTCSKELKAGSQRDMYTPTFTAALLTTAKMQVAISDYKCSSFYTHKPSLKTSKFLKSVSPEIPALQETEAGGSPEVRSSRPAWATR